MQRYCPVGYCTVCKKPVFQLDALNRPCRGEYFGHFCRGEVVGALDLNAWVACSCQEQTGAERKGHCTLCEGSGWRPREEAETQPSEVDSQELR